MLSYISPLYNARTLPLQGRRLVVLGSTGSIGRNVLRVAGENPDSFRVLALAGGDNVELLAEQAALWRPDYLAVRSEESIPELSPRLPSGYSPDIQVGQAAYEGLAALEEADLVVSALMGAAGLAPTVSALRRGKVVALANKESLVLAGDLIRRCCGETGASLLPVDSEHNALFQALAGSNEKEAAKLHLTASGGPFRDKDRAFLRDVTPEQALKHPSWSMGAKISVDSATLMNKGLEIIEAHHLFGADPEHIEVLIHPECIVHSLVEYRDGSTLAQLGLPDMRVPIAYCLSYPHRLEADLPGLDLAARGSLTFLPPDTELFPCLGLAREALRAGPSHQVVLNAANEVAVELFLQRRLSYFGIAEANRKALQEHSSISLNGVEDILSLDREVRERTRRSIRK
ncbi:MAG: 1-deoxy-D-xylulose-5-phosphate reductoisomerase [Desulfohalobiaceae bacterium]|nr:1-deoxy-D-xylulose-5-phosphate reductoisomerase [Desulfohalobiaceae bacterium]